MATSYSEIYTYFTDKISSYSFLRLTDDVLDDIFRSYLRGATVKFHACKVNLQDRDETLKQFNVDLDDYERNILASLMVIEWLDPMINDEKNLKNVLSDKDFQVFSPANILKQLMSLQSTLQTKVDRLISSYTYRDLEDTLGKMK